MPKQRKTPTTYFQVPLSIFAFGSSVDERLNTLIDYGCWYAGHAIWKKLDPEGQTSNLNALRTSRKHPQDMDPTKTEDIEFALGASIINVTYSTVVGFRGNKASFDKFSKDIDKRYGNDCLVRLRKDLVFEARDRKGMTFEELSVLAAILSVIGKRRVPVRITRKTISNRALGYRSTLIAKSELPRRGDGARPLSDAQITRITKTLLRRKFLNRSTFGRRLTYYSIGQSPEEFRNAITRKLTFRRASDALQNRTDKILTEKIRGLRAVGQTIPPLIGQPLDSTR